MKKAYFLAGTFLLTILWNTVAQTVKIPPVPDRWDTVRGATVIPETYQGKACLLVKSGAIFLKDVDLRDGIIEADISFSSQRNFPGFAFRMKDVDNFENFYVRPHQSGNPDATQYTPIFNGQAGWQLYHGEGYSKAFTFRVDQWHHIKIQLLGLEAAIYIDDMQTPLINVTELKHGWQGGKFGVIAGGAYLRIANFQYTPTRVSTPAAIPVPASGTDGVITQWHVSNVVSRNLFGDKYWLNPQIKKVLTWTKQHTEPSGTINLAKFGKWTEATNTMIAKVFIESESDQVKVLHFGFSDFVRVYFNDNVMYEGRDNFMSRDYRFLGTMGYFDTLFLPLKKGTNELWFVLAENFGGWGLQAKFENMENISLK